MMEEPRTHVPDAAEASGSREPVPFPHRILAVTNMYPGPRQMHQGTFVERQVAGLLRCGVPIEVLYVDRTGTGFAAYAGLGRRVLRRAAESRSDLVHVMYGGVMADTIVRCVRGLPTIVSFCGSDLLGSPEESFVRRWLSAYGVWASHRAARGATGVVVKSKNLFEVVVRRVEAGKVRIIPNGVDLERFRPMDRASCRERLGWSPSEFHVLFPANAGDPVKRPALARAAVETLRAGALRCNLHYLQGVSHAEVPRWLNGSDVLLLTSRHEGSPNIVKEALACNIPVVSVDVGDVRDRLEGIPGCFLAEADAEDLAAKLTLVHRGVGHVNGREPMHALSLENVAGQLRAFYHDTLAVWKGGPCGTRFDRRRAG
jgi:glycosyltransferase involved in cell wall biosynthesis